MPSNYVKIAFPNLVNSSLMKVFLLRMLAEKGRLIAPYGPKMGELKQIFGRGMGIAPPENSNVKCNKIQICNLTIGNNSRFRKNNQNQQKI